MLCHVSDAERYSAVGVTSGVKRATLVFSTRDGRDDVMRYSETSADHVSVEDAHGRVTESYSGSDGYSVLDASYNSDDRGRHFASGVSSVVVRRRMSLHTAQLR